MPSGGETLLSYVPTTERDRMPAFLINIRISGENVRASELVQQHFDHLNAFVGYLKSLPGVEVDFTMSQEWGGVATSDSISDVDDSLAAKPRINDNPFPLSPALDGRIRNTLSRCGFTTLGQLSWMSREELEGSGGIAKKSLDVIEAALDQYGLALLPSEVSLKQRDWEYLSVGALRLLGMLPESSFPRGLNHQLELGQYLSFSDEQLAVMLGEVLRQRILVDNDAVNQHRKFISRVKLFVS